MRSERTTVAIIGAGPAGLATGACMRQAGIDFVILEKEAAIAPAWRRHYRRLHLHTVKSRSALPFVPFPNEHSRYPSREQVLAYLTSYAARFDLQPQFGEAVTRVGRDSDGWRIESSTLALGVRHVVVASGLNAAPFSPSIDGMDTFRGRLLHSADYTDAKAFAGQSVLVVGMGNTGAEIALDLADAGARPTISIRGGVHIVPRELFGVPIQIVATLATRLLPNAANDIVFPPVLDLAIGRLTKYGIKRPKQGLLQDIAGRGRIPVIDVGTVRRIRDGTIRIAPDIAAVDPNGATFADGTHTGFDAIVLATGYRPNYRAFLSEADERNESGTLHFVGFRNPVTGLLREIAIDSQRVAKKIGRRAARA